MLNSHDGISVDKPALIGVHVLRQDALPAAAQIQPAASVTRIGLPYTSPYASPCDHSQQSWVTIFNTVKCRLQSALMEAQHPCRDEREQSWMREWVRDCEADLSQLQVILEQEHAQRWQLEVNAFDAQVDLAKLRAELAASQAGELRTRHQALHDCLTALPNRLYFFSRLAQALETAPQQRAALAVFLVDLDGFKSINDAHGHAAGDALLGIVAARLTRAIRSDDMVGRIGGDEFACLLMNIRDRLQLSRLACKVYDTVSAPVKIGDLIIHVHPSIGVAIFPECGRTSHSLLQSADMAMYQAKREQTGYAFFEGDDGSTS